MLPRLHIRLKEQQKKTDADCPYGMFSVRNREKLKTKVTEISPAINIIVYEEDIELMAKMGLKAYRFSLSWSRILPEGTGKVNEKGIEYYSNLIDCLLAHGIEPFVTLYHWDLPYTLHKRGGWLNEESPEWFAGYAKIAAEYFSDRGKYFFTFNEPQCFVGLGYLSDIHAPGINGPDRDAFTAAHHVLKAHGKAVQVLREYGKQPLKIGFAPAGKIHIPENCCSERCRSC